MKLTVDELLLLLARPSSLPAVFAASISRALAQGVLVWFCTFRVFALTDRARIFVRCRVVIVS